MIPSSPLPPSTTSTAPAPPPCSPTPEATVSPARFGVWHARTPLAAHHVFLDTWFRIAFSAFPTPQIGMAGSPRTYRPGGSAPASWATHPSPSRITDLPPTSPASTGELTPPPAPTSETPPSSEASTSSLTLQSSSKLYTTCLPTNGSTSGSRFSSSTSGRITLYSWKSIIKRTTIQITSCHPPQSGVDLSTPPRDLLISVGVTSTLTT